MKIKHISGVVAEVDDALGKRLVAETAEWASTRAPRAPKETKTNQE